LQLLAVLGLYDDDFHDDGNPDEEDEEITQVGPPKGVASGV
jgi:hypothetical protein